MSATPVRRSARLAAKASQTTTPNKVNHVFGSASPADLKVPSAPKKATRDISHLFTPAVPSRLSIPTTPIKPIAPKKAVYRSIADKLFDESQSYRENLIQEHIHTIITKQLEAAQRCKPNPWADEETLFEYSFIVAPLLDSLAQPYVNWDKVNVLEVYHIMFYWCPDARAVSINWMSDKFLHDWKVCRDRILNYGLVFPSSNQ